LLEKEGVEILFAPSVEEIYPNSNDQVTWVVVEGLSEKLDGRSRPGHFRGVTTVVSKLFHIVEPEVAFFGQKDAAQLAVIRRMVLDMNFPVEIVACPIVREPDGLAMSSRNAYLGPEERIAAASLSSALRLATAAYAAGEQRPVQLRRVLCDRLEAEPLAGVEYAEVVDPETFAPPGTLAVLAVRIGTTRLIDNHDLSKVFPG